MRRQRFFRFLSAFLAILMLSQSLCLTALADSDADPTAIVAEDIVNPDEDQVSAEPTVLEQEEELPPETEKKEELPAETTVPKQEEELPSETTVPKQEDDGDAEEEPIPTETQAEDRRQNFGSKYWGANRGFGTFDRTRVTYADGKVYTVVIPSGTDKDTVNRIISEAIFGEGAEVKDWEYYCTGTYGSRTNTAWGSIGGFTSKPALIKYTHPALAANDNGQYQVRVTGTTDEYTINKTAGKATSSINLNGGVTVGLVYDANGDLDSDATGKAIFSAVVASSVPALTVGEVTIAYYATPVVGATKAWMPLEGGTESLRSYPAISAGEQQIRITWSGNDTYEGCSAETTVTMTDRAAAPITLRPGEEVALNAEGGLKSAIFDAVVQVGEGLNLSASDVTIKYKSGLLWRDLENLTEPGTYELQVTWGGNGTYKSFEGTVEVTITSGLQASSIVLKEGATAALVYNSDSTFNSAATKEVIFNAVVDSIVPNLTADEVTIEYYATSSVTSTIKDWAPLEGKTGYPAISAGAQKVRISWGGNDAYEGCSAETTVTITDRAAAPITLLPGKEVDLNSDDLKSAIFTAVVQVDGGLSLSANDVTIQYSERGVLWNEVSGLNATGTYKFKVTWKGNETYNAFEATVEVAVKEAAPISLTDGLTVERKDGGDLKADIFAAVVNVTSQDLTLAATDVDIQYQGADAAWIDVTNDMTAGTYTIKVTWSGNDTYLSFADTVSLKVFVKAEAPITLSDNQLVVLAADSNPKSAIFSKVVSSTLALTADNVGIQYRAAGSNGVWTTVGDTMDAGAYEIQVTWDGDDAYKPFTGTVNLTVKLVAPITLNDNQTVVLAEGSNARSEIFSKVVNTTLTLTEDAVGIQYRTADSSDAWVTVGETMAAGTYEIQITWNGDDDYEAFEGIVTVTVEIPKPEKKDAPIELIPNQVVEHDAQKDLKSEIFAKVVKVTSEDLTLNADAVTILYKNNDQWSGLNDLTQPGTYEVKITWGGSDIYNPFEDTVSVTVKVDAPITLRENQIVERNTAGTLKSDIFNAVVVTSEDLTLTVDAVTIQYWNGEQWGDVSGLTTPGTYNVKVIWDGDTSYKRFEKTVPVTVKVDAPITLKENQIVERNTAGTLKSDIFAAVVVTSEELTLNAADVTIEYQSGDQWVDVSGLTTPGTYDVKVIWDGDANYKRFEKTVKVTVKVDAPITLKDGQIVALQDNLKSAIFTAVVETSAGLTLNADAVTIQYLSGEQWVELSGLTQPGTYQIKVIWDGNDSYKRYEGTEVVEVYPSTASPIPVTIPVDSTEATVNDILTKAIFGENVDTKEWEYECEGSWGLSKNTAWGSLAGFTSKSVYKHPALAANANGSYKVRVKGTEVVYTIEKTDGKTTSSITFKENATAALVYNDDATLNISETKTAIFNAVVDSIIPSDLTINDVTMEYNAGTVTAVWVPLEGKTGIAVSYPAISAGVQQIRISWESTDTYTAFSGETTVTLTDREEAPYELNSPIGAVKLTYNEDMTVKYDTLYTDIFNAVVAQSDVLNAGNVTITYYATANSLTGNDRIHDWMPLEGGNSSLLTYPAISAGEQQVRIYWEGSAQYAPTTIEVTVTVADREEAPYTTNNPISQVSLVYLEDVTVDYSALRTAIFGAVIAQSDVLTPENVTITYYATANSLTGNDLIHDWMPLEGGKSGVLTYPAISAGEQQVRIYWEGSQQYAPTTIVATVTVNDREALAFNLNEGPYEVGEIYNDQHNYDYDAMAQAIYNTVVASTSPIAVSFDEVTVEYDASPTSVITNFKPLNNTDLGTKPFDQGTWNIKISWGGNQQYAGSSVIVAVSIVDGRLDSAVVLNEGVSFTYNKDVSVMKQAIFDSVIDWNNSTLPAKDTLSVEDFTFTYNVQLSLLNGAGSDILDKLPGISDLQNAYVPLEGGSIDVLGQTVVSYPQIGAGVQRIKVVYNGNSEYKESDAAEGTVTINKASVKVSVKTTSMYVSQAQNGLNLVSTDPVDDFDLYVLYAGITSNVTTGIYLELPARYTSDSVVMNTVDQILAELGQPTLTQLMQEGITVGQLREMLNAAELIAALENLGMDTEAFGDILTVINKLPSVGNDLRVAFCTPDTAGVYTVTAFSANRNYNTGIGVGALVLKADKATLVWNQSIASKITVAEAQNADFGATLMVNDEVAKDQSSVRVLYSGITSKWKVYSSTTTPPTEPGRYTMTVVTLGGNYLASPKTRSFQIK